MKKVALKDIVAPRPPKDLKLGKILDYLTDLGWEYTCGCMTRSGMQTYSDRDWETFFIIGKNVCFG